MDRIAVERRVRKKGNKVSNFIIRQEGSSSVVADNLWEIRLGAEALVLGALAGGSEVRL